MIRLVGQYKSAGWASRLGVPADRRDVSA